MRFNFIIYFIEALTALTVIFVAFIIYVIKHKEGFLKFLVIAMGLLIIVAGITFLIEKPAMDSEDVIILNVNENQIVQKPITMYHFKDVTDNVKINGYIDYNELGTYLISFELDTLFGTYSQQSQVNIVDTKAPEITPEPEKAPFLMEQLYDYINQDDETTIIDKYIKSQIIHFYFVYVHPYFDVNGRTGRTLAMWYLLNTKAYSFIIFNRGINFNKAKYYEVIRNSIKYNNLDRFIKYMLSNVKDELIKEVAIKDITKDIKLSSLEIQTINYLLSMRNDLTTKDFYYFYNRFNDKTSIDTIKATILNPLEEKGIIILGDYSKNNPFNQKFSINEELIPTYLELKRND